MTFQVEQGEQFVPRLFAEFPLPIRSVNVSRPSLDDVFMSYTGSTIRDAEAGAGDRIRHSAQIFGAVADDGHHLAYVLVAQVLRPAAVGSRRTACDLDRVGARGRAIRQ